MLLNSFVILFARSPYTYTKRLGFPHHTTNHSHHPALILAQMSPMSDLLFLDENRILISEKLGKIWIAKINGFDDITEREVQSWGRVAELARYADRPLHQPLHCCPGFGAGQRHLGDGISHSSSR